MLPPYAVSVAYRIDSHGRTRSASVFFELLSKQFVSEAYSLPGFGSELPPLFLGWRKLVA